MSIKFRLIKLEEYFIKKPEKKRILSDEEIKSQKRALLFGWDCLKVNDDEYLSFRDLILNEFVYTSDQTESEKMATRNNFDTLFFDNWNLEQRAEFMFEVFFAYRLPTNYEYKILSNFSFSSLRPP